MSSGKTANSTDEFDKNSWNIYEYTYTLYLFEERYNILRFISGNAGLLFAR